mmetsp:Transcript_36255/g.144969  ORF Transcript_36255/g.144969 Transcript_36255/m.144969 type:complete len:280 (-) Transcript_36255:1986-2825(-)
MAEMTSSKLRRNRVLVLSTRGVTARFRHLMEDLRKLLPHGKKESKLDTKDRLSSANEICELRNCNWCLLFECRKHEDLYMWVTSIPSGPSVKFHVSNIHTMAELKFAGNNLLFSRALLSFDERFESTPHFRLLKEMLTNLFSAPQGHRKTKPFVDHIISFHILDKRIWIRHYQIVEATEGLKTTKAQKSSSSDLVEIGPRLVLSPVRIFSESFYGSTLYENPAFVHPNVVRRMLRNQNSKAYERRTIRKQKTDKRKQKLGRKKNEVENIFAEEPESDEH